jgi:hypothetical protein
MELRPFMHTTRTLAAVLCGAIALAAVERPPATVQTVVRAGRDDASAGNAQITQYLVALPHIAYGGGWQTQFVVGNTSSTPADVTLYYFGNNGDPLSVPYNGVSSTSTALSIPANGMKIIEPDWQSGTNAEGWVAVEYSNSGVKTQGVFLWTNPGPPVVYTEAAVPIVNQSGPDCVIPLPGTIAYTMPFDETGGNFSGYGFANTTNSAVTMSLTFYDPNGILLTQYSQQLPAFGHISFLLKSVVPTLEGHMGTMVLSGAGVVQLGFRFTPAYAFTTWQP